MPVAPRCAACVDEDGRSPGRVPRVRRQAKRARVRRGPNSLVVDWVDYLVPRLALTLTRHRKKNKNPNRRRRLEVSSLRRDCGSGGWGVGGMRGAARSLQEGYERMINGTIPLWCIRARRSHRHVRLAAPHRAGSSYRRRQLGRARPQRLP
jgi:hypothetical protein